MAVIYPPFLPEKCPSSEEKVRASLTNVDGITILHSVCWQSKRNNRQGDGEADFIVLIPKEGILILEVKGGDIEIENGTWYSTDRFQSKHRIKDPFVQVKDSKYALLNYLTHEDKKLKAIPIMHAVVFPDISVSQSLSMNSPKELIIDREDLNNIENVIERVTRHWGYNHKFPDSYLNDVCVLLAPTRYVQRLISDDIDETERGIIELTREQMKVLESLKRAKQAIIYGGAGTGKTVLAIEKARQLDKLKFKTLLICYNKLLKEKVSSLLASSTITVETYHSLTLKEAQKANLDIPNHLDSEWYESQAGQLFKHAANINKTNYDVIIIDEAQDFSYEWIISLRERLSQHGTFYIFADSHQDLYKRDWQEPEGVSPYELLQNCRNTTPIATTVAAIYQEKVIVSGLQGPTPQFVESNTIGESLDFVSTIVEHLISEKVDREHISVLSNTSQFIKDLKTQCVGEYVFSSYDKFGICAETIRRFKGLENHVVIVVIDDNETNETDDSIQSLCYVGMSRAKSALYLVSSKRVKDKLNWQ